MPAEIDQRGPLIVESDAHPSDRASILALTFDIGLDVRLGDRGGLFARQLFELVADFEVVGHVGKAEQGQLAQHRVGCNLGPC